MLRIDPVGTGNSIVFTELGGIIMGTREQVNQWLRDDRSAHGTTQVQLSKVEMKRVVMHMLMEIF